MKLQERKISIKNERHSALAIRYGMFIPLHHRVLNVHEVTWDSGYEGLDRATWIWRELLGAIDSRHRYTRKGWELS